MIPHPETICMLSALDYQERLQDAARDRLAASAQVEKHKPVIISAGIHRIAATLFGGFRMRWRSMHGVRLSRPLTTG
jgi:hypothetical protein